MRGENDMAIMQNASLEDNIALLRDVLHTQNELIRNTVNPDLSAVPRQIVLHNEVEKFYYGDGDHEGFYNDPELDGVCVVLGDANCGYTRTLPTEKMRSITEVTECIITLICTAALMLMNGWAILFYRGCGSRCLWPMISG